MEINQFCISCVCLPTLGTCQYFIFWRTSNLFLFCINCVLFFILTLHHNAVLSTFILVKDCIISPRSLMPKNVYFVSCKTVKLWLRLISKVEDFLSLNCTSALTSVCSGFFIFYLGLLAMCFQWGHPWSDSLYDCNERWMMSVIHRGQPYFNSANSGNYYSQDCFNLQIQHESISTVDWSSKGSSHYLKIVGA